MKNRRKIVFAFVLSIIVAATGCKAGYNKENTISTIYTGSYEVATPTGLMIQRDQDRDYTTVFIPEE